VIKSIIYFSFVLGLNQYRGKGEPYMHFDSTEIIQFFESEFQNLIYIISTNLLYPVIVILLGLIAWSLIELGSFLFEWRARHRDLEMMERGALEVKTLIETNNTGGASSALNKCCSNKFVRDFITGLSGFQGEFHSNNFLQIRVEKLLQDFDARITKRLEKTRFVARVAPIFGLMGTLIPMGPALLGLAQNDMQSLSDNMIIAFGTTVVGLMAGVIAYMISMIRNRWYAQDFDDMEYISEILLAEPLEFTPRVTPDIEKHVDQVPKKDILGVVKVISRFIHLDLFFTPNSVIIARTGGNILTNPVVFLALCGMLNVLVIFASLAGYTVLPLHLFLIFINLLLFLIFISLRRAAEERAAIKSRELSMLPVNDILKDDPLNKEVIYSDIDEINVSRSLVKISIKNQWTEVGRMVSPDHMDDLQVLPLCVTTGDKT
jgi:biopolymer transport protein ExbB/TolQ